MLTVDVRDRRVIGWCKRLLDLVDGSPPADRNN
jgi:hypothetical protein